MRDRIPPAQRLVAVFRSAVGRQMHRTFAGGITIKSAVAVSVDKGGAVSSCQREQNVYDGRIASHVTVWNKGRGNG